MAKLYKEYQNIATPTRIQYAQYKRSRDEVKENELALASKYMNQANQVKSTKTIRDILYDIYVLNSDVEKAEILKRRSK